MKYIWVIGLLVIAGCQSNPVAEEQASGRYEPQLVVGQSKKVTPVVDGSRKVPLIADQYETAPNETVIIPFQASNLTRSPSLNISFVVKTRGHCQQTYEETEVMLNDKLLEALDFREFEDEQVVDLNIYLPLQDIRQGQNQLVIAMGACDYDLDTLQLNKTTLSF